MELLQLKEEITALAYMLKRVTNGDFVVVDNHLNSLVNTFEYGDDLVDDVQADSVVGNVIVTRRVQVVKDKQDFKKCLNCPSFRKCKIESIAGAPIYVERTCVGAVALLLRKENRELHRSYKETEEYLELIARIFADMVQSRLYKQEIDYFTTLLGTVFGYVKEAVALTDGQRKILFVNEKFSSFFGDGKKIIGRNIEELLNTKVKKSLPAGQSCSLGERFDRPGYVSMKLVLIQRIGSHNKKEIFLYKFENINISTLQRQQAEIYDIRKWLVNCLGVSPGMRIARTSALQATENELSILIEGPYKYQNDELGHMFLLKDAADGEGILEIDCSRDSLVLEQELFGINRNMKGVLHMAKGRTLSLHSIQCMPLYLQKKVVDSLTVNQIRGEYGTNVRIIATAEKNLSELVERGLFFEKLYIYIARNRIELPELQRKEDVQYYFKKYMKYYGNIYHKAEVKVKEEVWDYLGNCVWNEGGNSIRQLTELILLNPDINLVTVDTVKMIQIKYGLKAMGGIEDENEEKIRRLLVYSGKSKKAIAEELGIGRATLYRWIKKYNL